MNQSKFIVLFCCVPSGMYFKRQARKIASLIIIAITRTALVKDTIKEIVI